MSILNNYYFLNNENLEIGFKEKMINSNHDFNILNNRFVDLYIEFRKKAINALVQATQPITRNIEHKFSSISSYYFESFIYNWIAFNSIYSCYGDTNDSESYKIKKIYSNSAANRVSISNKIKILVDNNDFINLVEDRFFEDNVYTNEKNNNENFKLNKNCISRKELFKLLTEKENLLCEFESRSQAPSCLTQTLYEFFTWRLKRIRNNLFHGNKSALNESDSRYVENGAKLLNLFLNTFEVDFVSNIKIY
jgi:hypothetical protein